MKQVISSVIMLIFVDY